MSYLSTLNDGRRAALAVMPSRCVIRRRDGSRTTGSDGFEVEGWEVLYTDHPMRLRDVSTGTGGNAPRVAGRSQQGVEVNHARHIASLYAFDAVTGNRIDLADGDYIEITDGENVGVIIRVVESDWADTKTARRVPVEAAERPRGWS